MIFTGVDTDDLINYYCARYSIPDRQTQLNLNSGNLDAYILPYLYRHSDGYRFRLTERHMREIIKARWWVGAIGRLKAGSFARTAVYLRMSKVSRSFYFSSLVYADSEFFNSFLSGLDPSRGPGMVPEGFTR